MNEHLRRWSGREVDLLRSMSVEGERYAAARTAGDFDTAAVIAGEAAGLIDDIPRAGQVIDRMVRAAAELLRGAAGIVIEDRSR